LEKVKGVADAGIRTKIGKTALVLKSEKLTRIDLGKRDSR